MFSSRLLNPLFSENATASRISDERLVANMLYIEAVLARVQGRLGIIPSEAAETIAAKAESLTVDWERLAHEIERAGVPLIELVRQLREHIGGEAANFVHWGATSQDIMDTALVLQIRAILDFLDSRLKPLVVGLSRLAKQHCSTLMVGRTHAQAALPITFGLKITTWIMPLLRHIERLRELKPRLLVVQFGGAVGTLAALGDRGLEVQAALADELELGIPLMSWHTQRDSLAEFANWLSLLTGSLAKMAQDIILLAQSEVGELRETEDLQRGGSSTMPQKSNPVISETIVAAARTNAALLSAMHNALIQEHERGTHGWQMEWLTLPQMMTLTAAALDKAVFLSEHLIVNEVEMRRNVEATHGTMQSEVMSFVLSPHLGRSKAKEVVKLASERAISENRHLVDVLREQLNYPLDWDSLRVEANYLGSSHAIIEKVLTEVQRVHG
jgi:3-carboxy-cis,cis-muconate cycloisomerase